MVTENMFKRILQNGDTVSRKWLIYSPSIGCLLCFVCKLFGKSKSALADKGFDEWKHAGVRLREHEHSSEHTSAMLAFCSRRKKTEMIEMMHFKEFIGKEKTNAQQMLSTILKANVISTFPNVTTALRIYLSLMCTNCSGERSFSRLVLLKTS